MLGLYWGAMYGTNDGNPANQCMVACAYDASKCPPGLPGCDYSRCPTGTASCDYYRPMADCRMRSLSQDMCRACKAKIKEALVAVVGP